MQRVRASGACACAGMVWVQITPSHLCPPGTVKRGPPRTLARRIALHCMSMHEVLAHHTLSIATVIERTGDARWCSLREVIDGGASPLG